MRWLVAVLTFLAVLVVTVFLFPVLGLDGPWGALGTVLAVVAAVVVFRGMRKAPHPE